MSIFYRVGVPLIVVALVALLVLSLVLYQRKRERLLREEARLLAEERWDGHCEFDNPDTGAKCQRVEFHLENHYREVYGKLITWQ